MNINNIKTLVQNRLDKVNQDLNDGNFDNYCGDSIIEAKNTLEWVMWMLNKV